MEIEKRIELVTEGAQEVVTEQELRTLLEKSSRPRAYVGYEPSGFIHIGWFIISRKLKQLLDADFEVIVLLADWHAFINDKLGGDIGKIQECGRYFIECYRAYGLGDAIDSGRLKFIWASDLANKATYWEKVLRVAKSATLSRIKRSMTIMGRKEDEGDLDSSKFIYPSMQAADIFDMEIDVAIGGMDQRHAHMLARDVADRLGWKKPIAMHTPLLPGLSKGGRMEMMVTRHGVLDHDKLAQKLEPDIAILVKNGQLSEGTRNLIEGLSVMTSEKRHKALEVLLAGKRRVGGKAPIYNIMHKGVDESVSVINPMELKDLDRMLNQARKELLDYLGVKDEGEEAFEYKMSKSDPDTGIYLHDTPEDINRKLKKAWCPEGVPDNPVMDICRYIIFPMQGKMTVVRPEKWGGDLVFENYNQLRSAFANKELHPQDLKKAVAADLSSILAPIRKYFKENPQSFSTLSKVRSSIGH
jgi:tyrosyl-tRNA synthetase